MFIKMGHYIRTYNMFKQLARYAGQGNRTIITGKRPVTLLEQGGNVRKRPFTRDFTSMTGFLRTRLIFFSGLRFVCQILQGNTRNKIQYRVKFVCGHVQ